MSNAARQIAAHRPSDLSNRPSARAGLLSAAPAALRAFFRIADAWQLTPEEQRVLLGEPARSTFYRWRHGRTGGVTLDTLERLSHLFGIYGALHAIYLDHAAADAWVRRPSPLPLFHNAPPLARLLRGAVADLIEVRRYLEGVTQGVA